jgi:N6-adenosine-specific RNA methylase IME4
VKYRTIVADPPWHYDKAGGYSWRQGAPSGQTRPMLTCPTMTVGEIAALPVGNLAEPDAHLYLWTTQRYLWDARPIAEAWGFACVKLLTWCKPPTGFSMGGTYGNASEFVLFCRRGSLPSLTKVPRDWWEWPRRGGHSAKPEAFIDMVEQVSPPPYVELFARRHRLGWDVWGLDSANTAHFDGAAS